MIYFSFIKPKNSCTGYKQYSHDEGIKLARHAFEREYSVKISEADILKTEKGKPYLKNNIASFNISHCDGLAVCAVSENQVGVDCETLRKVSSGVIRKCFSDSEAEFLSRSKIKELDYIRLWTLKESYVKYTGQGIDSSLCAFSFNLEGGFADFPCDCRFGQVIINNSFVITVCEKSNEMAGKIIAQITDFDIDKRDILEYNVFDK